jgi:predicted dienelactone hydrolase
VFDWPPMSGSYAVGTMEVTVRQELQARMWYPAEANPQGDRLPFVEDLIEGDAGRFAEALGLPEFCMAHLPLVRSRAVRDAAPSRDLPRFPSVVVVVPAGNAPGLYTHLCQTLASEGYIVALVGAASQDRVAEPAGSAAEGEAVVEAAVAAVDWMERVRPEEAGGALSGKADAGKVGIVAYGAAGAGVAEACADTGWFKAGVSVAGDAPGQVGAGRPVMAIRGAAESGPVAAAYDVVIPGARLQDFTDAALISPGLWMSAWQGPVAATYAVAVFDRWLKDKRPEILAADVSPFPGVTYRGMKEP